MKRVLFYVSNNLLTVVGTVIGAIKGHELRGFAGMFAGAVLLGFISHQVAKSGNLMSKILLFIVFILLSQYLKDMFILLVKDLFGL